jgi:hypothetical protein
LGFKIDWALIGKTGMKSDAVIEGFDVIEDSANLPDPDVIAAGDHRKSLIRPR